MQQSAKIDNTLMERRALLELLERLEDSSVTLQEMEQIGEKFRQAGRHAVRPLLACLWRETSGELITRYAYLLDFFDTEEWLDQLIQIALRRDDLGADGKAALRSALEGYGVDVHLPPFTDQFPGPDSPLAHAVNGSIRPGEDGIVTFLDNFLSYPDDIQKAVIAKLAEAADHQGARMLEALLWHEERSLVRASLAALGRIRDPFAAGVLARYLEDGAPELRDEAQRSLRRLSFLGVAPPPPPPALPFHAAYATPPDGDGYRSLLISRWTGEEKLAVLYLQVHERRGILAAWGAGSSDEEGFQTELEGFSVQDDLQRIDPSYALELLRDALYWSTDLCYLPADFYLRRGMFAGYDLTPKQFQPDFSGCPAKKRLSYHEGEEICKEIFSDPFFAGWFIADERVHAFAEEYRRGEAGEQVLEQFCSELLAPEVELIQERLLKSADLMRHCGRDGSMVARVVALAETLGSNRLPLHLHPFLRTFAIESIDIAREAMGQQDETRLPAVEKR